MRVYHDPFFNLLLTGFGLIVDLGFFRAGFYSSCYFYYFIYSICQVLGLALWKIFPLSHGWAWRSYMIGRFLGSSQRHFEIKSRHSALSFLDMEGLILYLPDFITQIVYSELEPLKGNYPVNIAYKITPTDHTSILPSTLYPLFLIKHSGAMQARLPESRSSQVNDLITPAIPKSIILIFLFSLLTSSMFSSLRSRWMSPLEWQ